MKNVFKTSVLGLSMLAMVPGLQGCTDQEISNAVGAIAIGAIVGGVVYACADGSLDCSCHSRRVTVCHDYRDYWGRWRRDCRDEYRSCVDKIVGSGEMASDGQVAEVFDLSIDGSHKLITAMQDAKENGNIQVILDLGLSREDVKNLSRLELPEQSGIDGLARSLNQDVSATHLMLERILEIAKKRQKSQPELELQVDAS